jgi:hypothetical protein
VEPEIEFPLPSSAILPFPTEFPSGDKSVSFTSPEAAVEVVELTAAWISIRA